MSSNEIDSSESASPSSQELDTENYRLTLAAALAEIRQDIDKILDLKAKAVELELALATQQSPMMMAKLKLCRDFADKCECSMKQTQENAL